MTPEKSNEKGGLDLSTELAIGSLTLAAMGVVYVSYYFAGFGINAIDYLSIGDFAVFALRNPWLVVYVGVATIGLALIPRLFSIGPLRKLGLYFAVLTIGVVGAACLASAETSKIRSLANQPSSVPDAGRQSCTILFDESKARPELSAHTPGKTTGTVLGKAGPFIVYFKGRDAFLMSEAIVEAVICDAKAQ